MSKTNRFTLIATFLLGILLYTVLRFADELPAPPLADTVREPTVAPSTFEQVDEPATDPDTRIGAAPLANDGIPRIRNYDELVAFLDARGLNGQLTVQASADWYAERGYLGSNPLLGVAPDTAPMAYYDTLDEATLQSMSDSGDAGATQTLAQRSMFMDPFLGLELYKKAVTQGSIYAIIKVSDVLDSFAGNYLSDFEGDPEMSKKMLNVRSQGYQRNLRMATLATAVAALRDGGPPIATDDLLQWITVVKDKTFAKNVPAACSWSEEKFMDHSIRRRVKGKPAVFTEPPPVFMVRPDLDAHLPCADEGYPVKFTMNLSGCTEQLVIGPLGDERTLYVCE